MAKKKPLRKEAAEEERKYQLTITAHQAAIVKEALDLYARIGIGQLHEIVNHFRFNCDPRLQGEDSYERMDLARDLLDTAKKVLFKLPGNASFGIYGDKVPDAYRAAWDIMQVIRHQFWKDYPEDQRTNYTVDAYEPTQSSRHQLPTIARL